MAKNLNYAGNDNVGKCYNDDADNCARYGRMYIQSEIACPSDWHLPSNDEWKTLLNFLSTTSAGKKLKATSPDWDGDDNYGFTALPGGYCGSGCPDIKKASNLNKSSFWWTATSGTSLSTSRSISSSTDNVSEYQSDPKSRFYVRCIHN